MPLCRFTEPVPFGALDGQPVHTALLLLSPSIDAHLQLLTLASMLLRDPAFRRLLKEGAAPDAILARVDALLEPIEERRR